MASAFCCICRTPHTTATCSTCPRYPRPHSPPNGCPRTRRTQIETSSTTTPHPSSNWPPHWATQRTPNSSDASKTPSTPPSTTPPCARIASQHTYQNRRGARLYNHEDARTRIILSRKELALTALCSRSLHPFTLLEARYLSKCGAPCEPFVALCESGALTALHFDSFWRCERLVMLCVNNCALHSEHFFFLG